MQLNEDLFKDENSLEELNYYISRSIKYNKTDIEESNDKLNLKIYLITKAGAEPQDFILDKVVLSKEQLLIKKLNFLIEDKDKYLEGIKLNKMIEEKRRRPHFKVQIC